MTEQSQKELGKTLWNIADTLRGSMNADDFRDYMLSFLFLRYLSDNYEAAAKKELGGDYPNLNISRYVSTAQPEAEIDLAATHRELVEIDDAIRQATKKHNEYLKELGLPPLP